MAVDPARQVRVDGLRDLQKALRQADKDFPKELRKANLGAAEVVAQETRQSFLSRPGVAPKVALTVRAVAQQRNASVKIGGELKGRSPKAIGAQTAMGSNFGTIGRFPQFPPVKKPDYSLYTSIYAKRAEVLDTYDDALGKLTKKAFPN